MTLTFPVTVANNLTPDAVLVNSASVTSTELPLPITASVEIIISSGPASENSTYLPAILKKQAG